MWSSMGRPLALLAPTAERIKQRIDAAEPKVPRVENLWHHGRQVVDPSFRTRVCGVAFDVSIQHRTKTQSRARPAVSLW